jgi:hypothetical protein
MFGMIPIIIGFLMFQRQFIKVLSGAVKDRHQAEPGADHHGGV